MDIEALVGRRLARRAVWSAPVTGVVAWALWTPAAGFWAVMGSLVAAGSFAVTGWALSRAARRSHFTLGAVAFGGFVVRLVIITFLVWVAVSMWDAHLYGIFLGVGTAWLVALTSEARRQVTAG